MQRYWGKDKKKTSAWKKPTSQGNFKRSKDEEKTGNLDSTLIRGGKKIPQEESTKGEKKRKKSLTGSGVFNFIKFQRKDLPVKRSRMHSLAGRPEQDGEVRRWKKLWGGGKRRPM